MEFDKQWQQAIAKTKIIHFYKPYLSSSRSTIVPYIFLAASEINLGDTVVRKGKVAIDSPLIVLPKNMPQFSGFQLQEELGIDQEALQLFFMVRGIRFPSLKYKHEISTIDIWEGDLEKAITEFQDELERKEDVETGLIVGPAQYWQISLLFYVTVLINRSAPSDLEQFFEDLRRNFLT